MQICLYFHQAQEFLPVHPQYIKLVDREKDIPEERRMNMRPNVANNTPEMERDST